MDFLTNLWQPLQLRFCKQNIFLLFLTQTLSKINLILITRFETHNQNFKNWKLSKRVHMLRFLLFFYHSQRRGFFEYLIFSPLAFLTFLTLANQ